MRRSCGPRAGSRARAAEPAPRRLRLTAAGLAILVLVQIYLGALVAGLDAGLVFNTWPQIDGALIPSAERLWFESPAWRNLFENTLTVQFDHRMVAYALWLAAVLHARRCHPRAGAAAPCSTARWRSPAPSPCRPASAS